MPVSLIVNVRDAAEAERALRACRDIGITDMQVEATGIDFDILHARIRPTHEERRVLNHGAGADEELADAYHKLRESGVRVRRRHDMVTETALILQDSH